MYKREKLPTTKKNKFHSDHFILFSFHLQSQELHYTYVWMCEVSSKKISKFTFYFIHLINLLDHKQRKRISICVCTNVKSFQQQKNKFHSDHFIDLITFNLQSQKLPYMYVWTCKVSS